MRYAIARNLARFAPRTVRFLSTNTGVFRVVGLVGIAFSIIAAALGNNLEAVQQLREEVLSRAPESLRGGYDRFFAEVVGKAGKFQ
jgi:hypothetical protein